LRENGAAARRRLEPSRRRTSRADRAQTSPAGRVHRLWRLFASRSSRLDAPTLGAAADLLDLAEGASSELFTDAVRDLTTDAETPLAAAAAASAAAMKLFRDAPRVDAEIFALWLADRARTLRPAEF
jgi:hypothetical protein